MKTSQDPRHKARVVRVQKMFSHSFLNSTKPNPALTPILDNLSSIDQAISQAAPNWPLDKINRLDLAVLRVATHELLYQDTPEKVVIDEAVEIAKKYGSESSSGFVNGVLGTILQAKAPKNNTSKESNHD